MPGAEITAHLGVVTANVVAGTGLGADFAASFSDLFGGRSGSYQRQLEAISAEVMSEVWRKARRLGATAVVGVRLDYDEISGKGKQMLMVSVTGTAVKTRAAAGAVLLEAPPDSVLSEEIRRESTVESLLARVAGGYSQGITFEKVWTQVNENAGPRLFPVVLDLVARQMPRLEAYNHEAIFASDAVRQGTEFLTALSFNDAREAVVSALAAPTPRAFPFLLRAVWALSMANYADVEAMLRSDNVWVRKGGLAVARSAQPSYDASDAVTMRTLANMLPESFPDVATRTDKKGVFSKGETVACPLCTEEIISGRCVMCGSDARGLYKWEPEPESVASALVEKARIVDALLERH